MTENELINELRECYNNAHRNDATVQIHLFAIKHSVDIKKSQLKINELVRQAGLSQGYTAEISKGVKLAAFVKEREE